MRKRTESRKEDASRNNPDNTKVKVKENDAAYTVKGGEGAESNRGEWKAKERQKAINTTAAANRIGSNSRTAETTRDEHPPEKSEVAKMRAAEAETGAEAERGADGERASSSTSSTSTAATTTAITTAVRNEKTVRFADGPQCSPPRIRSLETPAAAAAALVLEEHKEASGEAAVITAGHSHEITTSSQEEEEEEDFLLFVKGLKREVAGDHTEVRVCCCLNIYFILCTYCTLVSAVQTLWYGCIYHLCCFSLLPFQLETKYCHSEYKSHAMPHLPFLFDAKLDISHVI